MAKVLYQDVLASRYATSSLVGLWSANNKVILERELWVAALKAQKKLGRPIPDEAIHAYEKEVYNVDLESIDRREKVTRQDVKARLEEFNVLAGYEFCHAGFTSRDLTDNTEQLQILVSLKYIRDHTVTVLAELGRKAVEFRFLDICGRSHNVPGQCITLGKRFANVAEELLVAFDRLERLINFYPLRGIKGPMGTQQDMSDLFDSGHKALQLEDLIREHLGFGQVLDSVGQVYPRSLDYEVLSTLVQLSSAPGNFAKMVRLMAGHELLHEGFKEGQTASSAMPHKMNSRTCERINALVNVLGGFESMTKALVGDQWYEGDVSCSVVRRVALPGGFFALDGIYESILTVLAEMQVFPEMIAVELRRYLPFLSSTRLLIRAVKGGMGREKAHAIIKKCAIRSLEIVRTGKENPFVTLLSQESEFAVNQTEIESLVSDPQPGLSSMQIDKICTRIASLTERYPTATSYRPEPIL